MPSLLVAERQQPGLGVGLAELARALVPLLGPDSIGSRYVKMEYRYVFKYEKPIIPILYRQIDKIPFELATLNYIDFTRMDRSRSYQELIRVLSRHGRGTHA